MLSKAVFAIVALAGLGAIVATSPANTQSDQVGTLMDFDHPGESRKKRGLKAKSPKGKVTEGGNNSYAHRLPGKGGKAGPKWSDIELKRGR